jgi:hypothetical protein
VAGQGTGGLAGLNGQGTIPSSERNEDCEDFEYSGQIQFAP